MVRGEIDLATVPEMMDCVDSIIATAPEALVFDFTDVLFFGAAGIGGLVRIRNRLPDTSRMILRDPRPIVGKILTITR
jgi:anti-anti-sigma factor